MRKSRQAKYAQQAWSTCNFMGARTYVWSMISRLPLPRKGLGR